MVDQAVIFCGGYGRRLLPITNKIPKPMARINKKKVLPLFPWMIRFPFSFFWHITRGRVPTAPEVWRFYSYPILLEGDKLKDLYKCQYSGKEAIEYTDGIYESTVPVENKNSAVV